MFNDRDLGILGAGALLAVICLFLPFSFASRIVLGFLVLVGFMILALLRLGPDRVPPEVWLARRFRYQMEVRRYVNQQEPTTIRADDARQPAQNAPEATPPTAAVRPLELAWDEVGIYPLLSAFLGVVSVYFAVWLAGGGADQIALWYR